MRTTSGCSAFTSATISFPLPASLSRGGLRAGIESLIADLPTPVSLELVGPRPPAETETTAFVIVAEALTNVVKHADATRVGINVRRGPEQLSVEVADDGLGPRGEVTAGHGLLGMRERAALLGGTLEAASLPEGGFRVVARIPARSKTSVS